MRQLRVRSGRALTALVLGLASLAGCTAPGDDSGAFRTRRGPVDLSRPSPEPPSRVVLVSIAGLTPERYQAGPDGGEPRMPALARMARFGASAQALRTVVPATPHPVHATLATGLRPDRHGIMYESLLAGPGQPPVRPDAVQLVDGTLLWALIEATGRRAALLDWPGTVGADVTWRVPDVAPAEDGASWLEIQAQAATGSLFERLADEVPEPTPAGWPSPEERDRLMVDLACGLTREDAPPDLWLLRLGAPGRAAEQGGVTSDAAASAFARADQQLARLLGCFAAADLLDDSSWFVVGDRAQVSVHTEVFPNAVLARAGLIELSEDRRSVAAWAALARSGGAAAFVYATEESAAVEARDVLRAEAERTDAFRVVSARELQSLHADPQAWFGLEASPGFAFGDAPDAAPLRGSPRLAADGALSDPERSGAGLVAWGAGIRSGIVLPRARQIDVAPTMAALMGVRLDGADGVPMIGLFGFAVPQARPQSGPQP